MLWKWAMRWKCKWSWTCERLPQPEVVTLGVRAQTLPGCCYHMSFGDPLCFEELVSGTANSTHWTWTWVSETVKGHSVLNSGEEDRMRDALFFLARINDTCNATTLKRPQSHFLVRNLKSCLISHDQVAQLVEAPSHTPKCCEFDPQLGHIPRLWVWSLVRVHRGGNQWMFLSHHCFSHSPSLSPSLS